MNRTILFGYQIQNGKLTAQPQEAEGVKQIFSLYLDGTPQQQIADELNAAGNFYSLESPMWTRHRIARALQNTRYMGEKGYPAIIDRETFCMAHFMMEKRTRKWGDHPALCLVKKLRCAACGHSLRRSAQIQWRETLRFLCDGCGAKITITDTVLLAEIERQAAEYTPPATDTSHYVPSGDAVRLTNAINRGLEHPEHPEDVLSLILQGISARYACFPTRMTSTDLRRLVKEKDFDQAIQYITISADNAVTVVFKS